MPKSGAYINGMLDAIARNLIRTNRLMKHMDPQKGAKDKGAADQEVAAAGGEQVKMRHRKHIKREDGKKGPKTDE